MSWPRRPVGTSTTERVHDGQRKAETLVTKTVKLMYDPGSWFVGLIMKFAQL